MKTESRKNSEEQRERGGRGAIEKSAGRAGERETKTGREQEREWKRE